MGQRLPVEVVRCVLDLVPWPFQVAWSGGRGTGYLWSPWSQLPVQTMRAHRAYVNDIKFFPGGERLATAGGDGSVIIWRTMRGELLRTLRGHATGAEVRRVCAGGQPCAVSVVRIGTADVRGGRSSRNATQVCLR